MSWREGSSPPTMCGQFAQPFADLCVCQRCCFQTRWWCNRSGCSPQCKCKMFWGCWGSFQTSSAISGRRDADVPSSALHLCEILGDVNAEELKAVYPLHSCLVDGDGCVFSALSPEIHHQLLGLVDVEWEVVLLTSFSQGTHLLSVGCFIVVRDQAYHRCVVSKFDDDVGAMCGCTVMCLHGVQEWAEDTDLQCTSVDGQGRWGVVAHSDHLTSACQEVQDPAVQRSVQSQSLELHNQCGRHYVVKCWAVVHKHHSHIGVVIFQVRESCVQGEGNSIACGMVAAQCWGKLLLKVMHYNIALLPKKVINYVT